MREITANEFKELIKAEKDFVLHFWAEWNLYDFEQRKILEAIESTHKNIIFYQMNVDIPDNWEICLSHSVQGPPTIVRYQSGELIRREVGLTKGKKIGELLS